MNQPQWIEVDRYISELFVANEPAMEAALAESVKADLPAIAVAANQGKFLQILALAMRARRILEVGTLGGYSSLWLAKALPPGGRLITLEVDPKHAEVARGNFARAGVADRIDLRVGPALEALPKLVEEDGGPFDMIFIDADKPNYPRYLEWAVRLARRGTLILADNVVREGQVIDATSKDERVRGTRQFNEAFAHHPGIVATALQTVGAKGYDGFAIGVVVEPS